MTTQTVEAPTNPEITVISRITSIPLVASSLSTIHTTLTNNAYTRQLYTTVQGLSNSVLSYTEPLQKRFAPLLVRADSYANKGFDALESRYPYPFRTPSEDIVKDLKGRSDHAYDIANQTIDEKVKTPAYSVAQGIDQRFALIVDYFEAAVNKLHPNGSTEQTAAPAAEAKYQYQRAYALSRDLSDHLRTYSTEQINQLKTQNILVQRATETSQTLGVLASTSYGTAQMKVQALSDTMLAELQRIQASTAALPATLQASFHDISTHISTAITDLSAILNSQDPFQEKVHKVRDMVQERVYPLLEAATTRVQEILGVLKARVTEKEGTVVATANGVVTNGSGTTTASNGNGHT
ncbi:hypothetical protein AcV5_002341 [Taiwanofungus camphoratus]|nr:hypothetical protein AcV5_002341 [Antrodia cinnamomea]KAI0941877.1 hypothetical protein AcV7_002446 [Antrodia cinnamomea]